MSLQDKNLLLLDIQALSMKNKVLSQNNVKLMQENAELQRDLVASKSTIFELQAELNCAKQNIASFNEKIEKCFVYVGKIVEECTSMHSCCNSYKSTTSPIVRLERMNNNKQPIEPVNGSFVSRAPNTNYVNISFSEFQEENITNENDQEDQDSDVSEDENDENKENEPVQPLTPISEECSRIDEEIRSRSSSTSHLSSINFTKSSLSPELSVLLRNDIDISRDKIPLTLTTESSVCLQTPSFSNLGDKSTTSGTLPWSQTISHTSTTIRKNSDNSETPLSTITSNTLTEFNKSLRSIRKSLNILQNTESPKKPTKPNTLTPKRLVIEVERLSSELVESQQKKLSENTSILSESQDGKSKISSARRRKASKPKKSTKRIENEEKRSVYDSGSETSIEASPRAKGRPKRSARPASLKEPSLNKKMRRSR